MPGLARVTYTHLGRNDEEAQAAFLDDEFKLACPVFHQYMFTADLDGVLRCIREKRPRLILVTSTFVTLWSAPDRWNVFISQGERLLRDRYLLTLTRPDPIGPVQVWKLRSGAK